MHTEFDPIRYFMLFLQVGFGIDWEGPVPDQEDDTTISILETECLLSCSDMQELQEHVQALAPSDQYGIDLFERTLEFVSNVP